MGTLIDGPLDPIDDIIELSAPEIVEYFPDDEITVRRNPDVRPARVTAGDRAADVCAVALPVGGLGISLRSEILLAARVSRIGLVGRVQLQVRVANINPGVEDRDLRPRARDTDAISDLRDVDLLQSVRVTAVLVCRRLVCLERHVLVNPFDTRTLGELPQRNVLGVHIDQHCVRDPEAVPQFHPGTLQREPADRLLTPVCMLFQRLYPVSSRRNGPEIRRFESDHDRLAAFLGPTHPLVEYLSPPSTGHCRPHLRGMKYGC